MQQAQAAIDSARAAGADRFAREEFAAAEGALKRSHDAVAQRDYRLALDAALDARERAQTAAKQAADEKAAARADAERALAEADAALHESRAKLKAAETARASAKVLVAARQAIADGETAVQEARTTLEQGDYLAAADRSRAAATRLRGTTRDLDARSYHRHTPPALNQIEKIDLTFGAEYANRALPYRQSIVRRLSCTALALVRATPQRGLLVCTSSSARH